MKNKMPPDRAALSLPCRLLAEQLYLTSQQIKIILVIVFFLSILTIASLWRVVPREMLLTWLVLVNFPSVMRLLLFYMQGKYDIELRLLGFLNILLAAWSGTAWGAAGYFFPIYGDVNVLQFMTVVLFGVTAGSVPGLSAFVPSYYAFSIPVMTSLAYRYYNLGDDMNASASIYCLIFLAINMAFSLVINKSLVQSIRLRFENTDLIKSLRREKDKAISASNAKSTFLAAASHDLRQPLHAMGFFIEALKKQITDDGQQLLLQKIERTSDNLRGQLNDLLDISKIDAGIITPHTNPLSLKEIFRTVKAEFTPLAQEKNITLRCLDVSWIIESDAHMIERILNNLVSNAIRYTDRGGKILIGCRKRGDRLSLEVHDTGIGIPKHLINHIFADYYQIGNPERDRNKGLGLGLSIVKGMCELLRHGIEVRSIKGKGTSFLITVPLSSRLPRRETPSALPEHLKMAVGKIILIDDERDALDAMSGLLEQWGHTVIRFESEKDALHYLQHHDFQPDMIITDFRLRERRTGAQAITAINHYLGKNTPAVLITGDTARDRMLQARASGHTLLHKPIMPAALRTVINNTLSEARQSRVKIAQEN